MQSASLPHARSARAGSILASLVYLLPTACNHTRLDETPELIAVAHQETAASVLTAALPIQEEAVQRAAIDSIEAGDYGHARGLLDELLLIQYIASAHSYLSAGLPADALNELDQALALAPRDTETQMLKADASLSLAEKGIATGATSTLITGSLQDAFEYYTRVSASEPRAVFGATRSARMLGNTEDAIAWARRGLELIESGEITAKGLEPLPQRSIVEAFFGAYTKSRAEMNALAQAAQIERDAEESAALDAPDARGATAESGEAVDPDSATEDADAVESAPLDPVLDAETRLLFRETERALGALLGHASTSPWAWGKLADLYEWDGRFDVALQRLGQGLERLPADPSLMRRISRIAGRVSDRGEVLDTLLSVTRESPGNALCYWYVGIERFQQALESFSAGDYAPDGFRAAEANFRKCRTLEELNTDACLDYEIVCRGGLGWCAYYGEENLELAMEEFLSMNDLRERGIEWGYTDRLRTGVLGLAFVGDSFNQRLDNLSASKAFEAAHHAAPEDGTWANNAGFFLRDAAVELEIDGQRLARAARGKITDEEKLNELRLLIGGDSAVAGGPEERSRFLAEAERRLAQSRDLMERSWLAYEKAAAAFPDDIRIVNDAALVLVYYNHTRLDVAEEMLKRCVEMGLDQVPAAALLLADPELDESERTALEVELFDLKEAWGDAHQNLGVLEWVHKKDGTAALPYLERSVEIGPDPRPDLSNNLMPLVRGESELVKGDFFDLASWGRIPGQPRESSLEK